MNTGYHNNGANQILPMMCHVFTRVTDFTLINSMTYLMKYTAKGINASNMLVKLSMLYKVSLEQFSKLHFLEPSLIWVRVKLCSWNKNWKQYIIVVWI